MKNVHMLLCLVGMLILTTACDQENRTLPRPEVKELFGEEYLSTYYLPSTLFQVAFINEDTKKTQGFIIDKTGAISTYEADKASYQARSNQLISVTEYYLDNLTSTAVSTGVSVNLDELAEFVKDVIREARSEIEIREVENSGSVATNYFGYTYASHTEDNDCGCSSNNSAGKEVSFSQLPLRADGTKNVVTHSSNVAPKVVKWLQNLDVFKELQSEITDL